MFRFFRSIRQKLFFQGKVSRYLGYAIGEIILIMVGIFLALQLNIWNEDRIARGQESIILAEIHKEFLHNRAEWERAISRYREIREKLDSLYDSFPLDLQTADLDAVAETLDHNSWIGDYDGSSTTIDKLKNTAFDIISNEELRALLLQWEVLLEDYKHSEERAIRLFVEDFLPTMRPKIKRPYQKGFKDPRSDMKFLNTVEFENLIISRRNAVNNLFRFEENNSYGNPNIVEFLDRIIELTKPED